MHLSSLSRTSARSPLFSTGTKSPQIPRFKKRWLHQTLSRKAILMPAMSPFMTSGTITRWKKKEGDAFSPGDILLQIESDFARVDVEAENAGILGRILLPDGAENVPVEQVIALVASHDASHATSYALTTSPTIPSPTNRPIASPMRSGAFPMLFSPSTHRSPQLPEVHYAHPRGMATQHVNKSKLTIVPPSPRMTISLPIKSVSSAQLYTEAASGMKPLRQQEQREQASDTPADGGHIRRAIVSNLSRPPLSG